MVGFTTQRKERKRQRQRDKDRERALKARRFFEVIVFRTMVKPPWAGNNVLNFYFFQNFLKKNWKEGGITFLFGDSDKKSLISIRVDIASTLFICSCVHTEYVAEIRTLNLGLKYKLFLGVVLLMILVRH